jgi:hypothetical protein
MTNRGYVADTERGCSAERFWASGRVVPSRQGVLPATKSVSSVSKTIEEA